MGYRSTVMLMFYPETKEEWPLVKLWLQENWPKDDSLGIADDLEYRDDDHAALLQYESVKWYASNSDVMAIEDTIRRFAETFNAHGEDDTMRRIACYEFVRIGEDDDDIETDRSSYNHYRLTIKRSIEID